MENILFQNDYTVSKPNSLFFSSPPKNDNTCFWYQLLWIILLQSSGISRNFQSWFPELGKDFESSGLLCCRSVLTIWKSYVPTQHILITAQIIQKQELLFYDLSYCHCISPPLTLLHIALLHPFSLLQLVKRMYIISDLGRH